MNNQFLLGAALYALGGAALLMATIVGIVCATCSDLIKEEAATRLERVPLWLLELASQRLPADCRDQIVRDDWLPELEHISRASPGLPLTRLVRSTAYAASLIRSASAIGVALGEVRRKRTVHLVINDEAMVSWWPAEARVRELDRQVPLAGSRVIRLSKPLSDGRVAIGLQAAIEIHDILVTNNVREIALPEWVLDLEAFPEVGRALKRAGVLKRVVRSSS